MKKRAAMAGMIMLATISASERSAAANTRPIRLITIESGIRTLLQKPTEKPVL